MAFLPYPPNTTSEAVAIFNQDVPILHEVVHGDDSTEVLTEGGLIPSVSNVLKQIDYRFADKEAEYDAAIGSLIITAPFDFTSGGTVTAHNQVVLWPISAGGDGNQYRWDGALDKVVPPSSTPAGTGGIAVGAWVDVGQAALRNDLANGTADIGGESSLAIAQITKSWAPYFVESYRTVGLSDSDTIQAALNAIEASPTSGSRLIFDAGRLYTYDREHSIKNINNMIIDLNGATLKRADASVTSTTLSTALTVSGGTVLEVDSVPASWRVGEFITAFTSDSDADTNRDRRRITNISGNLVTIAAAFFFSPSKTTLPIGTTISKAFSVFSGRPSSSDSTFYPLTAGINRRIFIQNGTIDGNRDNQINYSWRYIPEILIHGNGGIISGVNFKNIASESFVGHGFSVVDCLYEDIGGSCYHTSVNDATVDDAGFAFFRGNTCRRICLATTVKTGHSEGAITFSWNPGNFIITDNIFEDLTEYFLGAFSTSTEANSGEFLTASNNIIKTAKGIFDTFPSPELGIHITDNIFHDCGNNITKTQTLNNSIVSTFRNNTLTGDTTAAQNSYIDRQKVGTRRNGNAFSGAQMQYVAATVIPAYTPTIDSGAVTVSERDGVNYHAFVSNGISGSVHYHPSGTASGSAYSQFNPSTLTYSVGTNISNGITELKAGNFQTKLRATPDGIDTPNFTGLHLGDKDTDGSWRFSISGSNLLIQRRESATWVTKSTIAS